MGARAFNVFCLASIILAMVPIAFSWVSTDESLPGSVGKEVSAVEIMTNEVTSNCSCLLMSATIFVTATVFLLVSPLGAFVQIAGIGVFFIGAPFNLYCHGAYCVWTGHAGVGIAVAGVAAILPLIGMVRPWGITRSLKLKRMKERFITLGLTEE